MATYTITPDMLPEGYEVRVVDGDGRLVCTATAPGEFMAKDGMTLHSVPVQVDEEPSEADLAKSKLASTDAGMARVVEDLIAALVGKGVIEETDLPDSAQAKLTERTTLRQQIQAVEP